MCPSVKSYGNVPAEFVSSALVAPLKPLGELIDPALVSDAVKVMLFHLERNPVVLNARVGVGQEVFGVIESGL